MNKLRSLSELYRTRNPFRPTRHTRCGGLRVLENYIDHKHANSVVCVENTDV